MVAQRRRHSGDLNDQLGYFAGVIEVDTQRDDAKAGSADGCASDVGMPLHRARVPR